MVSVFSSSAIPSTTSLNVAPEWLIFLKQPVPIVSEKYQENVHVLASSIVSIGTHV